VADDHVPPVTDEVKVVVPLTQIISLPMSVPALGVVQFTAVHNFESDPKQAPTLPLGVTVIRTASLGFNPFTVYGDVTFVAVTATPPFTV
jgi:hypothetical protein